MAKKKDNLVAAAQVAGPEIVGEMKDIPKSARERQLVDRAELVGLAGQVSGSLIYVRNSRWPTAREDFPHDPGLRTCDKFFQDALGGPLYVDEPKSARELKGCLLKAEKLKARGVRYCYIYRDQETGEDPSVEEILAQMGDERGVA